MSANQDIEKATSKKPKIEIQGSEPEKQQQQEEKIEPVDPKKIGKLLSKGAEFWQTQQHPDGMLYFKQLPDGQRLELLDKGDRISGELSKDPVQLGAQIELMLALAKEKGWKELDINTNDKEVKEALARAAVAAGLGVKDKTLERQAREQLGFKPQVSMGTDAEKDPAIQVAKEAGVPNPQRVELKPGEKAEGRIIGMDDKSVYQHLGGNKVVAHPKAEMEKQIDLAKAVGAKVEISRGNDGELKASMPRRPIPTKEQQVQVKVNDLER